MGGTSRISREAYVRICERLGVQVPGPTRPGGETPPAYSPVIQVLSGPKAHVRVADYTLIWISAAKCAQ